MAAQASSAPNPERTRLLLAVAGMLAVLTVVYYAWSFYDGLSTDLNDSIELKTTQHAKLTRMINNSDQLLELNRVLKIYKQDLENKRFVTGSTMPLAEAQFQNIVKEAAEKCDLNVTSSRTLPIKVDKGLTFMNLNVNARGSIHAIRDFILAIQESPQIVFFDELEIKQINTREKRFFYLQARLTALGKV